MRIQKKSTQSLLLSAIMGSMLLLTNLQVEPVLAKSIKPLHESATIKLGELRSFNVYDMEAHDFSASREAVPQEIVEYARTALQASQQLRYDDRAQGLLRFRCANGNCSKIRAEVTDGAGGTVLWKKVQRYRPYPWLDFGFLPDGKRYANHIVSRLSQDYMKTLKAVPLKIEIPE